MAHRIRSVLTGNASIKAILKTLDEAPRPLTIHEVCCRANTSLSVFYQYRLSMMNLNLIKRHPTKRKQPHGGAPSSLWLRGEGEVPEMVHQPRAKREGDHREGKKLTPRELEVMRWLSFGKTNEEIGAILNVESSTVKNHMHHILAKLCTPTRAGAVGHAYRTGLLLVATQAPVEALATQD